MKESAKLVERLMAAPAPVAPPKPGVKPAPAPSRPAPSTPSRPDPWRRKDIQPGHEPRPKARMSNVRAEAVELLKRNGMAHFVK